MLQLGDEKPGKPERRSKKKEIVRREGRKVNPPGTHPRSLQKKESKTFD